MSKKGSSGREFLVKSNYFALTSKTIWEVHQYHVEFSPPIEHAVGKNALLVRQRATLGAFLYDRGSNIFTIWKLDNDRTEIVTRDHKDEEVLITVTRVGLISPLESRFIQVLNVIMKKALKELNLQPVGRDYFDPQAMVCVLYSIYTLLDGCCKERNFLFKLDFYTSASH